MSSTSSRSELRRRRVTLEDAKARLGGPEDKLFAEVLAHGTLSVEVYAPRGVDPQKPHRRDELYVVVTGRSGTRLDPATCCSCRPASSTGSRTSRRTS